MSTRASYRFTVWDVVVNGVIGARIIPPHLRWRILRLIGMQVERCLVAPRSFFGSRKVTIGRGAAINVGAFIDGSGHVTLGEKVYLGPEVMIITSTHDIEGPARRAGTTRSLPVTIGAGSWLGARVTVMPGVTIGEGCMIASGAVVTKDCKPNSLYAGVPAVRKFGLSDGTAEPAATATV